MASSKEEYFRQVMSGADRSFAAGILRTAASCIEPFYRGVTYLRNKFYDGGVFRTHNLGRPTISVGNITTGGTGKTPVVQWLAEAVRKRGKHPAILMRGYRKNGAGISDEQVLLDRALSPEDATGPIMVIANADRAAGARAALARNPHTDIFILDDGMQHRRARRDVEIVLINAVDPFGCGRVFPRGFLRESVSGLNRADIVLLSHASEIDAAARKQIESRVHQLNPAAAVFHIDHQITGFRDASGQRFGLEALQGRRFFAFCGIGNPQSFFSQLERLGTCVGRHAFGDHHEFTRSDLDHIHEQAASAGADTLVATEKDWVKLERLHAPDPSVPIWRAELRISFLDDAAEQILNLIQRKWKSASGQPTFTS